MKDDQGNSFNLNGEPFGSGGEGKIYRTDRPGFVVKIYEKTPTPEQVSKLKVMIANPPKASPSDPGDVAIAWPTSLAYKGKQCIGFLMPEIGRNVQFIQVYNPKSRKKILPKCNWLFLHTAARNFTEIVKDLHKSGYVIGDIKPQNILVNDRAFVSVVDTDSFQVKNGNTVYRCHVVTEGFTPPEMLGFDPSNITQTLYHDRYRVALIIYHLLFTRHPFNEGTWQGSSDEQSQVDKMKSGIWLYNSQGLLKSHISTIPLQVIHPKLQELFKRCFNDGHKDPTKRPSAEDWSTALKVAINDLTSCGKIDTHKYSRTYGKCYWCERKNILNGVDIFEGSAKPVISPPPPSIPPVQTTSSTPIPPPSPPPPAKKIIGFVFLAIATICFIGGAIPFGFILGFIGFSCFSD
ncbi:hypothetical protein H6F44_16380 [Pseudanabaena sp. FACHB-1277]|jgi:DNA-binding helix-hairpin-helix protein with protein kinase domain|uniref:Protein kinase domain-containing protein n=1 Tax=Pseudanabaena cinerea FACHB-1277 TaxID=2949581 RepID=A0A926Z7D1_9CYAN|nr:hypothetical protein [Pseudanabaena cinerea]MBD2151685.1 hypothetical protein [Pseudanabaena cinerea FACHB-1277]